MSDKIAQHIADQLSAIPDASKRHLQTSQSLPGGMVRKNDHDYIDFASNDYLGLAHHPALKERSTAWIKKFGNGSGASRLVTGTSEQVTEIEHKIAEMKGSETALVMNSGYQANSSVLTSLLTIKTKNAPLLFTDKLNHASLHSGARQSGIRQIRYRHNDLSHLSDLLEKNDAKNHPSFIVTESVFSMDGDRLDVEAISKLAKKYDAFLYIDEAHATGVLGNNGAGLCKGENVDLIMGTFGKALGSFGAYVACSASTKELLINTCTGFIYATALPPSVLGAVDAALDLLPHLSHERSQIELHGTKLRQAIDKLGFDTRDSSTQIIPVIIGSDTQVLLAGNILEEKGIICGVIRPPTVPNNTARLRICLSAAHNVHQIDKLIDALEIISREIHQ